MQRVPSHHALAAVGMIVLAALLFAMMDAATKFMSGFMTLVTVVWSRYTIQAATMALWLWRGGGARRFRTVHPRFQVMRGVLLVGISVLGFFGLRHMPLAEFTAIVMLSPVLVTAVSSALLKQKISPLRWALVSGGFGGTLIVIRPGSGLFGAIVVVPLLAMLGLTAYSLLTSRLALLMEDPYTTQFYTGAAGSLALTPLLLWQADALPAIWRQLSPGLLTLLFGIGILSTLGHLLLVMAFRRAAAAALMPFTYVQIGFAAIMSWLVFQHAPDSWAWFGMLTIAACGAATAWLNMREAQRAGVPPLALAPEVE
jgi:drug/metabolite transporter (DMT)-like permease